MVESCRCPKRSGIYEVIKQGEDYFVMRPDNTVLTQSRGRADVEINALKILKRELEIEPPFSVIAPAFCSYYMAFFQSIIHHLQLGCLVL